MCGAGPMRSPPPCAPQSAKLEVSVKTFSRTAASVLLGFLVASTAARARQSEDAAPQAQQASPSASIPSYPNTAQGLEKFMKDMMKAAKNGDHDVVAAYAKSLVLPDAESWFKSVFGDEHGARLAAVSDRVRSEIELSAPDAVTKFLSEERTRVEAVRFDDSCNSRATDTEYPFLLLRERPEPLYDVRFGDGQTESVWAYFAYVDGGFRYIGNLQRNSARPAPRRRASSAPQSSAQQPGESADQEPPPPPRIRVGGRGGGSAHSSRHSEIPP